MSTLAFTNLSNSNSIRLSVSGAPTGKYYRLWVVDKENNTTIIDGGDLGYQQISSSDFDLVDIFPFVTQTGKIRVNFSVYNSADSNTYNSTYSVAKDFNIYWAELKFDANGGTGGPDSLKQYTLGNYIQFYIPDEEPTKANHAFAGWKKTDGSYAGSTITITNISASYNYCPSYTLTADWTPAYAITIKFNNNGGTGGPGEITEYVKTSTSTYSFKFSNYEEPTRSGYKFLGWKYGNTIYWDNSFTALPGTHTVTAEWQKIYKLILKFSVDGTVQTTATFETTSPTLSNNVYYYPEKINFLEINGYQIPTKTNYKFVSWKYGSSYYDGEGRNIASNNFPDWPCNTFTLTAIWEEAYTVTFNFYDRNNFLQSISVAKSAPDETSGNKNYLKNINFTDEDLMPGYSIPTRTGYLFTYWQLHNRTEQYNSIGQRINDSSTTNYYFPMWECGTSYRLDANWREKPNTNITLCDNQNTKHFIYVTGTIQTAAKTSSQYPYWATILQATMWNGSTWVPY